MRNIYTKNGIVKMKIGGIFIASNGNWTREMYLMKAGRYYKFPFKKVRSRRFKK